MSRSWAVAVRGAAVSQNITHSQLRSLSDAESAVGPAAPATPPLRPARPSNYSFNSGKSLEKCSHIFVSGVRFLTRAP
jgi:hypothetical protein